jgi:hypothetical protein
MSDSYCTGGAMSDSYCTGGAMSDDYCTGGAMSDTKIAENIKTHVLYSISFFRKSFLL